MNQGDELKPELRLFLSVDIEGSTDFKSRHQTPDDQRPKWLEVFKGFFSALPQYVVEGYEDLPDKIIQPSEQLSAWKFAGDEVVFSVILRRHEEVLAHFSALWKAIPRLEAKWKDDGK